MRMKMSNARVVFERSHSYLRLLPACSKIARTNVKVGQICPEMRVNEMRALYDKHLKVSPFLKSHQKTHNFIKYEAI